MALDFPGQSSPDGLANVNIGINNPATNIDIDSIIASNKANIRGILNNSNLNSNDSNQNNSSDTSLLQGALSFGHSKFTDYIIDSLAYQYNSFNESDSTSDSELSILPQKNLLNADSIGNMLDKVWIEIHHPAIKYFQFAFYQLNKSVKDDPNANNSTKRQNYQSKYNKYNNNNNNNNNNASTGAQLFVEYRKLFDKFIKFIAKAYDFYYSLLKTMLNTYDLSIYIPVKKICSTLKINLSSLDLNVRDSRLPLSNSSNLISSIVYLIHKCVLFIGDLSRYRTLIAKTYLPSTSISKEDNNNYSKSIELYKLSLLILPSLGDPYNHIAIIDNLKDDKFNVVYNFIRSSLTSSPLSIAHSNLINLLTKHPRTNSILRKFEHLNSLDRNSITKNDRLGLLKSQFLILFNYNLLPSKWKLKTGYLISGHSIASIENDFYKLLSTLDFHKQIFNDFYFKQMVILTGGFELLIDPNFSKNLNLSQSGGVISDYLDFLFRYLETFLKVCIKICDDHMADDDSKNRSPCDLKIMSFSTSLFPVVRLLVCWFNEREIARAYLKRSTKISNLLAALINRLIFYIDKEKVETIFKNFSVKYNLKSSLTSILNQKPVRDRLFKEDVALREFKPINYALGDFDDSHLYSKEPESILALIGELPESQDNKVNVENDANENKNQKESKKEKNKENQDQNQDEKDDNNEDSNNNDDIHEDNGILKEAGNGTSKENLVDLNVKVRDNLLRLVAIVVLGKKLIIENTSNIKWVSDVININADPDNNFDNSLGKFAILDDIDLKITLPDIPVDVPVVTTNSAIRDRNSNPNKNAKNNKKNNNSNYNNPTTQAYAGSSFSNFGQPSPESFGKFDKLKKNKTSNKAISRPQTSSTVNTNTSAGNNFDSKKSRGFNSINYQLQQRPMTSPGFTDKKSNEESQSHSQYVDMVASIVNEENDDCNVTKNKRVQYSSNDSRNNSNENNSSHLNNEGNYNFGNIGITNTVNHDTQNNNTNPDFNKDNININESTSSFSNASYMKYFNQWDSSNNSNLSIDDKKTQAQFRPVSQSQSQSQSQDQGQDQSEPLPRDDTKDKTSNDHLIDQMNQMNIIGSNDPNNLRFSQVDGFPQFNNSMIENSNSNNFQNFNINHMFNDMNKFNLNNHINNFGPMHAMTNMDNMMNSMNNLNNLGNFNNMNSMNMSMNGIPMIDHLPVNMNNITNMQMNPMEMNMNMNMNMPMNLNMNMNLNNHNIKNFNSMHPIMGLDNNMDLNNNINDINFDRMRSSSAFNVDKSSPKDKFISSNEN